MSKPVFEDLFVFSSGRRNRASYFLHSISVASAVIAIVGIFAMSAPTAFDPGAAGYSDLTSALYVALIGLLIFPFILSSWAVGAQRCRDFGWTGWAILLTALPYIGFLFSLALLFMPGADGENQYGPDPRI